VAGSPSAPSRRSIFAASFIGTSIEWYDYYIFGTAAALVFGTLFFPQFSSVAGTLAAFGTFAVGFIARPLGAAVIGHYGDRIGRKAMLVLTLLLTGGATALIGLLPTYAAIGVGAPLLLVLLRLLQGFGVGGEWGGAVLIATEHASPRRRAVYGSFAQFGVPIGVLTSNLAFPRRGRPARRVVRVLGLAHPVPAVDRARRGRLRRAQPPAGRAGVRAGQGEAGDEHGAVHRAPAPPPPGAGAGEPRLDRTAGHRLHRDRLHAQLRHHRAGLRAHHPAHADHALDGRMGGDDRRRGPAVRPLRLAPRVRHRRPDGGDLAGPDVRAGNTGSAGLAGLAFAVAAVVQGIMAGAQGGLFSEIFPVRVRYSGISIAYQVGGMVGGAITPLVATALFGATGSSTPIALYVTALSLLSLVAVFGLREGSARSPDQVPAR
jgi:MFS family permease